MVLFSVGKSLDEYRSRGDRLRDNKFNDNKLSSKTKKPPITEAFLFKFLI